MKLLFKFGMKEHMKALIEEGQLYMGTFKSYRNNDNFEIGDKNEGAHRIINSTNVSFNNVEKNTGKLSFLGELQDVTVREFNEHFENSRVYCMYRVETELNDLTNLSSLLDVKLLKRFGYDSIVMIANVGEFYSRIDNFMSNKGFIYRRDLVAYKDLNNGGEELNPFIKDIRFKHQSEYRLCIQKVKGKEPIKLSLGNLDDISLIFDIQNVNKIVLSLNEADFK
ncbi:hypothetical protein [Agarivorans sp. QJM3NY_33]|uniref:hypothetical protein n=1 Tax=Agarivorans sp. QJM3NY_33 TaxID=3421432 RepID=UPI003D7CB771